MKNISNIAGQGILITALVIASLQSNAQIADKNKDIITDPAAIEKLRVEVESNPEDLKKHQDYIKAVGVETPELEKQYEVWMKQFPQSASIPFALGRCLLQ
ncbi:MAG: hypothetical protein WDO16_24880 [Bacteroidota bacterium]